MSSRPVTPSRTVDPVADLADLHRELDARLSGSDAALRRQYPGERAARQPIYAVYVPACRNTADLPARWGEQAAVTLAEPGRPDELATVLGLPEHLVTSIYSRVLSKLGGEPGDNLRIDFEDGYGLHGDEEEDGVVRVATAAATFTEQDIDRALTAHPRIGDQPVGRSAEVRWSRGEQAGVADDVSTAPALREVNSRYDQRFGRVFRICANGLTAEQILAAAPERPSHDARTEITVVGSELSKIAPLRVRMPLTA